MTLLEIVSVAGLGFGAGLIGGLAGIGGSLIMLPGLYLLYPRSAAADHHLFVAAAMAVNVAVAVPSALKHRAAGAIRKDLLRVLLPTAMVMIVAGVLLSNQVDGKILKLALATFILAYCVLNIVRLRSKGADVDPGTENSTTVRLMACGAAGGATAGLLGLGGGVVVVPMLQVLCRVPLRQAIATSSAVICLTAVIGAGLKIATLPSHGHEVTAALKLAGLMAPTAIIGGRLGAGLTHSLPLKTVRIVVTVLLLLSAANLIRTSL